MFINTTESLAKIKSLLESAYVYGYKDETDNTADNQMNGDLETISKEVNIKEIFKTVSPTQYSILQTKSFTDFSEDDMKLFYAECYFIAAKFLNLWSLVHESDMYKSTYDYSTKIHGEEKSGRLYTAKTYTKMAYDYINSLSPEYGKEQTVRHISIARY